MSAMPHHVAIKVCNITNAINFYSLLGFTVETKFITGPARAAWLIQNQQQQQYYYTQEKDEVDNNNNKHHQAAQVGFRIELIEVPSYMLQQQQQQQQQQRRHRAIDLMTHVTLLGLNHLALDVTYNCIQSQQRQQQQQQQQQELMGGEQSQYQLQEWIHDINTTSIKTYNKTIQYATPITTLHITKRIIGKQVYEIAFIYDADGTIIELVYYCGDISPPLNSNTTNPAMADGWEPWDGIGFVQ
jgi:catechol 2,3-dioxygenase-like lactoylglutathione lyase family enzyme